MEVDLASNALGTSVTEPKGCMGAMADWQEVHGPRHARRYAYIYIFVRQRQQVELKSNKTYRNNDK